MKKIKFITMHKGGGGGTTTVQQVPDWARPYIEGAMGQATEQYTAGNFSKVAGTNPLLDKAFGQGADLVSTAAEGGVNALRDSTLRLKQLAEQGSGFTGGETLKEGAVTRAGAKLADISNQFGNAGTLGSARQAIANEAVKTNLAATFANIDKDIAEKNAAIKMQAESGISNASNVGYNLASGNVNTLAALGGQERSIEQQQLDAPYQAVSRFASTVYGSPAKQSAVAGAPGGK